MMRIPVFLSCYRMRDASGTMITIRERRLVRRDPADRIIAIVEAPRGTRVRRRVDQHGREQLIVPISRSIWARFRGDVAVISAKYVIGTARSRAYGLSLVEMPDVETAAIITPTTEEAVT